MLNSSLEDVTYFVDDVGKELTIGEIDFKAIVVSKPEGDFADKEIKTLYPIQRGNQIKYQDRDYIIISEVTTKGYLNVATMRNTNLSIDSEIRIPAEPIGWDDFNNPIYEIIGYDDFWNPIYADEQVIVIHKKGIVEMEKFAILNNSVFRFNQNEITVTFAEEEGDQSQFSLDYVFNILGTAYKVINQNLTKKGLLILTCEKDL